MAAIVGLLVLMVYLCTNIAYKFIPDKAKKNVKRMFTRKKDGAAAEDEPGGIKRGRSVVEAGLSFRDTVLDFFFLREPGDRETVTLLMRGMPIPATYGFPDTDGTMKANAFEFVKQFHPSISICYVHPLHPFTARERFIVYLCTVAFNFVWTAAEIYCYAKQRRRRRRLAARGRNCVGVGPGLGAVRNSDGASRAAFVVHGSDDD